MLIVVVGTGRTGSCWVGRLLDSHPDIHCTIEDRETFRLARSMAYRPSGSERHWEKLVAQYRARVHACSERGQHYADKSHPLLWFWPRLWHEFRDEGVWFWLVRRNRYDVVQSMLRHGAIREQVESGWRELEVPSPFAGIGPGEQQYYEQLTLWERCALRWASHEAAAKSLVAKCPNVVQLQYEKLLSEPAAVLAEAQRRMGLQRAFPPAQPRHPRHYEPALSSHQRELIDRTVDAFIPWWQ